MGELLYVGCDKIDKSLSFKVSTLSSSVKSARLLCCQDGNSWLKTETTSARFSKTVTFSTDLD